MSYTDQQLLGLAGLDTDRTTNGGTDSKLSQILTFPGSKPSGDSIMGMKPINPNYDNLIR